MIGYLLIFAAIIIVCVFLNKLSLKVGIPVLLLFIILGMLMGVRTDFALEDKQHVEHICTFALIFIMFYGGFGTRWKTAKPIVVEAGLLATLGVFATAALLALFCHFALNWSWLESMLMGAVISSTDAASVFSILRTRKMGLKNNTAPLIEMESGSNDPCSNLLTIVVLAMLTSKTSAGQVAWMVVAQFLFGAGGGILIAMGAAWVLKRVRLADGFGSMYMLAVALLSYALPSAIGGNGYLSAYIVGIYLGNTSFHGRKTLANFFDGITSLMQIIIFYALGLVSDHWALKAAVVPALLIFAFLTFVARPVAVASILAPFRKYPPRQLGLISFVGLRGAASIVFAIMTITGGAVLEHDVFSIVFVIVLISISIQGSLIPWASRLFKMEDKSENVLTTFTSYSEENDVTFGKIVISPDSSWCGKRVMDIQVPKDLLLAMVIRGDEQILPNGSTVLQDGDKVILCMKSCQGKVEASLWEHPLSRNSKWIGKAVCEFERKDELLVLIKRGDDSIIPNGRTILEDGDVLVISTQNDSEV